MYLDYEEYIEDLIENTNSIKESYEPYLLNYLFYNHSNFMKERVSELKNSRYCDSMPIIIRRYFNNLVDIGVFYDCI